MVSIFLRAMTFLLSHRGCCFDALVEYRSVDSGGNAATIATYLILNWCKYVGMSLHEIILRKILVNKWEIKSQASCKNISFLKRNTK